MKLKTIIISSFLFTILSINAQAGIRDVKARLSVGDTISTSMVSVQEYGDASDIIASADRGSSIDRKVTGWRVIIFVDNTQAARANANIALSSFKEMFPDIPANIDYDSPNWKVTVGYCLTGEEATVLWGRLKNRFDTAVRTRQTFPLKALTE